MIRTIVLLIINLPLGFILYVLTNVLLAYMIEASGLGSKYPQLTVPNQLLSIIHLIVSLIITYILLNRVLKHQKKSLP